MEVFWLNFTLAMSLRCPYKLRASHLAWFQGLAKGKNDLALNSIVKHLMQQLYCSIP